MKLRCGTRGQTCAPTECAARLIAGVTICGASYWAHASTASTPCKAGTHTQRRLPRSEWPSACAAKLSSASSTWLAVAHVALLGAGRAAAAATSSTQRSAKLAPLDMTSAGKSEIGVKPGKVLTSERYQ